MDKKNSNSFCCYCGSSESLTRDHIPPKAIFNKPRPSDLITVQSCFKCNNDASASDEKFKTFLGMHVAKEGGEAERLFKEGVIPTTKHNSKLRNEILQSMYPADIVNINKEGIITGRGKAVPWDNDAHDSTIERITRGLFFHHYSRVIPKSADITIYWFNRPPEGINHKLEENSIANGLFKYSYNKVIGSGYSSIWLYNFYEGHYAGSIIL